jgi:hypothetical protein
MKCTDSSKQSVKIQIDSQLVDKLIIYLKKYYPNI